VQRTEVAAWEQLIVPTPESSIVPVGDVSMFVVRAGEGDVPVVFLSGLGEATLTWVAVLPALATTCRVLAYDRPGMGSSPPTTRSRSVEQLGAECGGLLEALDAAPAVLVGHSLGGLIAIEAWRRHPELVAGLVLIDPADPAVLRRKTLVMAQRMVLWLPTALSAVGLWRRVARSAGRRAADLAGVSESARNVLAAAVTDTLLSPAARATTSRELTDAVASVASSSEPITAPLTVLSATSGGVSKKARASWTQGHKAMVDRAPNGRHVVVEGGHYLQRERSDAVIDAIREQVARIRRPTA
jgi:pimeloyl-ACP methyl ester carboxylesterase